MADHLVVISFVMHDMDGTPEQSATIVAEDWQVMRDYWQSPGTEFTAEELEPMPEASPLGFLNDDGGLL